MLKILILPIATTLVGVSIPFIFPTIYGITTGIIIVVVSIIGFRLLVKKSFQDLNKKYEGTFASLLKESLVCPKCKTKWDVGSEKCRNCGFSVELKHGKLSILGKR